MEHTSPELVPRKKCPEQTGNIKMISCKLRYWEEFSKLRKLRKSGVIH